MATKRPRPTRVRSFVRALVVRWRGELAQDERAAWRSSRFRRGVRASVGSSTALAIIAVVALVTMNELSRLIHDVIGDGGRTHSLNEVIGFSAGTESEAWSDWHGAASFSPAAFIAIRTLVDLVFIVCYVTLARRLIFWFRDHASTRSASTAPPKSARPGLRIVFFVLVFDCAEDALLLLFASWLHTGVPGWLTWLLVVVTYAKWAATIVLVLYLLLGRLTGEGLRSFIPKALRALYAQRLSALVVIAVGVISLLTAEGVLEQAADVYRGWILPPSADFPLVPGLQVLPMLLALLSFTFVGVGLLALGRRRARQYAQRTVEGVKRRDQHRKSWIGWLIVGGAVLLLALIVAIASGWKSGDWVPTLILAALILVVGAVSAVFDKKDIPVPDPLGELYLADQAPAVKTAGDLLVACWIAICALGPFKAILSPLFLAASGLFAGTDYGSVFPALLIIEIVFLAAGLLVPIWFRHSLRTGRLFPQRTRTAVAASGPARTAVANALSTDPDVDSPLFRRLGRALTAVSIGLLVVCLIIPARMGYALGPVAALVLLLGAWTTVIGALVLVLGAHRTPSVFALLRLRATPVIALLIVLPIVAASAAGSPGLHAIQVTANGTPTVRSDLQGAFNYWYGTQKCALELPESKTKVYPLLLVAAQGGGIRAATWTVDVMRELPRDGECASSATLLSSGASGGSIGLALFRHTGNHYTDPETMTTARLAGSAALGADLVGLVDGDLVGAVSGIQVPTATTPMDLGLPWAWQDRTALQEATWAADNAQLARPWNAAPLSPTGYLLLNSADSVSNCKVVVSQIDLAPNPASGSKAPDDKTAASNAARCNGASADLSNTIDLPDYLGDCMFDLSWATAAELSARFPFVSPSGRISNLSLPKNCHQGLQDMQLVDGGVMENSALGTISDLSPQLAEIIATRNAAANGDTLPFVVPIVMFVQNEPGDDVTAQADGTRPDVLIPLPALKSEPLALVTPSAWLTRLSSSLKDVCDSGESYSDCAGAVTEVRTLVKNGIAVVAPTTSPSVSVPLGWTLSEFSRARLFLEAEIQAECGKKDRDPALKSSCSTTSDYGDLGDVLDLYQDDERATG